MSCLCPLYPQPEQQLSAKSLVRQLKQAGDECSVAMETLRDRLDKFQAPPTPADPASAGYLVSACICYASCLASLSVGGLPAGLWRGECGG